MKSPICISPHLRSTVCGTSHTVRAAGIYLQTEAPKQVRVSSGWERLGPGRDGPPHSPLPLHRPLNRQHLPSLHWQITQPTGDPPGPLISLFRQVTNTSSWAFCPKLSSRPIADKLCTARRGWRRAVAAETLLQSRARKSPRCSFLLILAGCHTLMGYLRPGVGGRKLSPKFLTELNGLEPTLNCLLQSWHGKEERMYGKGQAQTARAVSLGKGESRWGVPATLWPPGSSERPPRNLY